MEALVDGAALTREPRELTEAVRRKLVPPLVRRRAIPYLEPLVLAPAFESELQAWLVEGSFAPHPELALHLRVSALAYLGSVVRERAAIVCTSALRPFLAEFLARFDVRLDVFAYAELPPELELRPALVLEPPTTAALAG